MTARRKEGHRRGSGAATLASLGGDGRTRLCVACRQRRVRDALLQCAAPGRSSGRHVYVCIRRACLQKALPPSAATAMALASQATARLAQLVGLARRAGLVVLGAGALKREPNHAPLVVLVASDAAERTRRELGAQALPVPLTSDALGRAAGQKPVAAVGLRPGRHAAQAAYWQRVWYEAAPNNFQQSQHTEVVG